MGIYFEYDFKNGKEIEKREKCYLCEKENILYAEYYILEGDVYKLYKDSRIIVKGKEIPVGSRTHAICDECLQKWPTEEELVEKILARRLEERKVQYKQEFEKYQKMIDQKKQEISLKQKELQILEQELKDLEKKAASLKSMME